ncbi:hypothetical protein K2173_010236 [Erythroxylum novogranatense]|uniref:DUF4283 domain-containing protein n=1 Tax=Erythroxylum novogranatense TaxID=1862640 RepID=A0AAV8UC30_9ROSI|nr:hypothetical protein K2173_010236 [Erythroxylum novogranatense]
MEEVQLVTCSAPITNNFQWTRKFCLEYERNDYLQPKVLVDDDIVQEVSGLDLIDLGFGFYLVKFAEKDDILQIVSDGPYIVGVFIGGAWRRVEYEGNLGVYSGCGHVNHRIENCTEVVVPMTTGEVTVGVAKDMAMIDSTSNSKEDIFSPWLVAQHPQRRRLYLTLSLEIGLNLYKWRIEWLARWIRARLGLARGFLVFVGQWSKSYRSVSEGPMVVTRRKEALEVPRILLAEIPVLSVLDNVGDKVVANFVSIKPKPPDRIAGDVPMVLSAALAPKVSCGVNGVVYR